MASTSERLDEKAEEELSKLIIRPDLKPEFRKDLPGRGVFYIVGTINEMQFEYWREPDDDIVLHLRNGIDNIRIYSYEKNIRGVLVNDRKYPNPAVKVCGQIERESWQCPSDLEQEATDAVQLGAKKLEEMHVYLHKTAPRLMQLISDYFSRKLVPADDLLDMRPNSEIFAGFNLTDKKA